MADEPKPLGGLIVVDNREGIERVAVDWGFNPPLNPDGTPVAQQPANHAWHPSTVLRIAVSPLPDDLSQDFFVGLAEMPLAVFDEEAVMTDAEWKAIEDASEPDAVVEGESC